MSTALFFPHGVRPATRPDDKLAEAVRIEVERPAGAAEVSRWVRWLGIPFLASAALFGAAISTGAQWLMGAAFGVGPEVMIFAYIYLALSSDSNSELTDPAVETASFVGHVGIRSTVTAVAHRIEDTSGVR